MSIIMEQWNIHFQCFKKFENIIIRNCKLSIFRYVEIVECISDFHKGIKYSFVIKAIASKWFENDMSVSEKALSWIRYVLPLKNEK